MLASAALNYSSDFNLQLMLISLGVIAVSAVIGFVPIVLARRRSHRRAELIIASVILWTSITAASICWFVVRQHEYTASVQQSIMEGYYDPQDQSDKPRPPVALWTVAGACYGLLIFWSSRGN